MGIKPGALRQSNALPPGGLDWSDYIAGWVDECGGWVALADQLIHRASAPVEIAHDVQTVERGLRRLSQRGHRSGGQYGRWMLRYFGLTTSVEYWLKWMGQYHSRFSDLPCALRSDQLALWNRPPIAESPLACWLYVASASVHLSRVNQIACEDALRRAELLCAKAGASAVVEITLLRARIDTDSGDLATAQQRYTTITNLLESGTVDAVDVAPYFARLQDQKAYHITKRSNNDTPDWLEAKSMYDAIELTDSSTPFVRFRKCAGLAYCAWKLGAIPQAQQLAGLAAQHAGDGGLVRMRVIALNMLSRVSPAAEARIINARAHQMATVLEDENLIFRVGCCDQSRNDE